MDPLLLTNINGIAMIADLALSFYCTVVTICNSSPATSDRWICASLSTFCTEVTVSCWSRDCSACAPDPCCDVILWCDCGYERNAEE